MVSEAFTNACIFGGGAGLVKSSVEIQSCNTIKSSSSGATFPQARVVKIYYRALLDAQHRTVGSEIFPNVSGGIMAAHKAVRIHA